MLRPKKVSGFWAYVGFKISVLTWFFAVVFIFFGVGGNFNFNFLFFCQQVKYVIHLYMVIGTRLNFTYTKYSG